MDPDRAALIGVGTGALTGTAIGDGGVILPGIGAVVGEEAAERNLIVD